MADAIYFEQRDDGTVVLVGDWPREVLFAQELFDNADPALVQKDGHNVHLTVANGAAQYWITREEPAAAVDGGRVYLASLMIGTVGAKETIRVAGDEVAAQV